MPCILQYTTGHNALAGVPWVYLEGKAVAKALTDAAIQKYAPPTGSALSVKPLKQTALPLRSRPISTTSARTSAGGNGERAYWACITALMASRRQSQTGCVSVGVQGRSAPLTRRISKRLLPKHDGRQF